MNSHAHALASHPLCGLALVLTGLAETGCGTSVPANDNYPLHAQVPFEDIASTVPTQVGGCMDDNPNPPSYCM